MNFERRHFRKKQWSKAGAVWTHAALFALLLAGSQAQAGSLTPHAPGAQPLLRMAKAQSSSGGSSAAAFTLSANYNAPSGMLITPGSVTLSWADTLAAGSTFSIYRSTTSGFTPSATTLLASGLANTTATYTDSKVTPSTQYFYVVEEVTSSGGFGNASSQAAVIVPAMQVILQDVVDINAGDFGTDTYTSSVTPSVQWLPDGAPNGAFTFQGTGRESDGATITIPASLTNPAPQAVYKTEHIAPFTYTIPNLTPNGNYVVNLHFDEDYFTTANQRTSNVFINGTKVLSNFDIYATAGGAHTANIQSFATQADSSGTITVAMTSVINAGLLSGIEVGVGGYPGNPQGPTLIGQPTGLTASPVSATAVDLNWNPSYTPGVTYSVYRSTASGFTPSAGILVASGLTAGSYQDTTVLGDTTYYYLVVATLTTDGSTIQSNQASVLTPVENGVLNEPAIVSIAAGDATYTPYTDTLGNKWITDTANTSYLTVTGGNAATDNNYIAIPSGMLNAGPEVLYQFNRTGAATWVVGGTGPNGAALFQPNTPYVVALDFEESWWNKSTNTASTRAFNVIINGIQVLTNYDPEYVAGDWHIANVQSFAMNADANGKFTIQTTAGKSDTPLLCGIQIGTGTAGVIPATPSALTATAASDSEIDLSWTASATAPTKYDVYASTTSGFTPGSANLVEAGVTGTTFAHTGLAANTTYYYAVQADNTFATSTFLTANATTKPLPCTTLPTVPGAVLAHAVSDTEIDLSWTASTAPAGCTVTYNVYRGAAAGAESASALNTNSFFPSSYADTGLTAATPYFYVVEAVDEAGSSVASVEGNATTMAAGNTLWTLAWGDDFNGTANTTYDHSKWWNEVKVNTGNVWGDNTIQSTSDSLSNVYLDGNGHLVEAMTYNANPGTGQTAYTSGRLHSVQNIGYGKIEANVQNPVGQGLGAAFWALGTNFYNFNTNPPTAGAVGWPACGELDMMELQSSSPAHNGSTIHGTETDGGTDYEYVGLSVPMDLPAGEPNFDQSFHTITTLWGPYHVQYFMDGVQYGDVNLADLSTADIWPLMGPSDNYSINLILSSGVGGNGGAPGTTGFPANYTFDYVHYSKLTAGAPAAVSGLQASQVYSNAVQLSWNPSTTQGTTYNVYKSTTANATLDLSTLVEQNATANSINVSGLNPATTYYFTVLASNWGGESVVNSSDVIAVATAAAGNSSTVRLSAGGYGVGDYMPSQFVSGGSTNHHLHVAMDLSQVTNPAPAQVYDSERWGPSTWTIPNLTPGAQYTVRLHFVEAAHTAVQQRAFNVAINAQTVLTNFDVFAAAGGPKRVVTQSFVVSADGNGEIGIQTLMGDSTVSGIDLNPTVSAIDVTPVPPPPAAPTALTARAANAGEIDLNWTASTTAGAQYLVFRSTTSGFTPASGVQVNATPIAGTSFADTTVTASTTYYYLVEATNANGNSAASNQANATTEGAKPAAPSNLTANTNTVDEVNLSWTPSTTSGALYMVFRGTSSGFTPSAANQVTPGPILASSWSDENIAAATTYYYVVETVNSNGISAPSNQASATTANFLAPTATPVFSVPSGTYAAAQSVTIGDATPGATLYYTTDGSTPTLHSAVYSGPITVSASETLKAIAAYGTLKNSAVATAVYTLRPSAPTFSVKGGTYNGSQTVTISDAAPSATLYYTTDGSTPVPNAGTTQLYSAPISINATTTLKAIAAVSGWANTGVSTAVYTLEPVAPTFSLKGGNYYSIHTVTLANTTPNASVYYTTDGSAPLPNAGTTLVYTGAITIPTTTTLKAIAVVAGWTKSNTSTAIYNLILPTPTFSVKGGTYSTPQTVTLQDAIPNASFYYTTDGSVPVAGAGTTQLYTAPIAVNATTTLKAIAVMNGWTKSAAATVIYTMKAASPVFSLKSGSYKAPQTLTITDTTPGIAIYYTTDGSAPVPNAGTTQLYSGPISLTAKTTVKALAGGVTGWTNSATVSASYSM